MKLENLFHGMVIGVTSVDLFFIISGFVIFLTLNKTKTAKDFIVSRFSRLLLVYWICVTITTSFILLNEFIFGDPTNDIFTKYLANLTMFQRYWGFGDIDPPYWTLRVEMLFYIMMLILFISNQIKNIVNIGCVLLLLIIFYNSTLFTYFPVAYDFFNKYFSLVNHFPLFFAGILFYLIKFKKPLLILFVLYVNNKLKFIVNRYTLYLGSISYSLYLIHSYFCTNFLVPLLTNKFHVNFYVASFLFALPLVILLSHLITNKVEKPAMGFIRSKYKQ